MDDRRAALEAAQRALVARFVESWGSSIEQLCTSSLEPASPLTADERAALTEGDELQSALQVELSRWLWSHHQFLELDAGARGELAQSLARALHALAEDGSATEALARQREELASFLRARLGASPHDVVSSEYSPELQLALLGLEGRELQPPLLDLGCGPSAALVEALRARGWLAHGIDRVAPPELSLGSDWLQFEYGEARFGTVLSHLGFSLYFLHHHLAGRDTAFDYARTYMAILRGLTIGGLFAYTPGLPFLEALLDAGKYRVRHVPFADPLRVPVLHDIERRSGLALSHATHVERRG